ncbi:MAG: MlaD family protein [Phycisphaerales bacterium]|nr:MlaD family protein [Phycisphaerales bacterium]
MKKESRIVLVFIVALFLLVFGIEFLKGKNIFDTGTKIFATFSSTKGLIVSNPVYVNGFLVGTVYDITNADKSLKRIRVTIKLKKLYDIPLNSYATIIKDPLGTPSIDIRLGDSNVFIKNKDTLATEYSEGIFGALASKILPVSSEIQATTASLHTLLNSINNILDVEAQHEVRVSVKNLEIAIANFATITKNMAYLTNKDSGALTESIKHINEITKGIAIHENSITQTIDNLEAVSMQLKNADIGGTVGDVKNMIGHLDEVLNQLNARDNSLGLLLHDKKLYNNLNSTIQGTHILLDDIRLHPKRYVQFSLFGKRSKEAPLLAPLSTDTVMSK